MPTTKPSVSEASNPTLLRALSTLDLTAVGINGVVGAGIFLIPAIVAKVLGGGGVWAYLIAGLIISLIVLCFAEAGSWIQTTGGPYVYTRQVFGRFVGFQMGWMTWLARVTGLAALSNGFATYLGYFWAPAASSQKIVAITVLILFVTGINLVGVGFGKHVINALTIAKLLPLALFVAAGFFFINWSRYQSWQFADASRLGEGMLQLVFTLTGWEVLVIPAEEIKNPRKSIPQALMITIAFATAFYALIQLVAYGVLAGIDRAATPLASAAEVFGGRAAGTAITLAALLSITGTCSGLMLTGPRMLYAFAVEGDIPSPFGRVHRKYRTPHFSILASALTAFGLAYLGNFTQMAALAAIARLISYVGVCLAIPFLRKQVPQDASRFILPGGWMIPILATACSLWLISHSTQNQFVLAASAAALGCVLYAASWAGRRVSRST